MFGACKEACDLESWPTRERIEALKRIVEFGWRLHNTGISCDPLVFSFRNPNSAIRNQKGTASQKLCPLAPIPFNGCMRNRSLLR